MKKLLFYLLLLTVFTPLVFFEKLPFPYIVEKTLYFRFIFTLILGVWTIVAFQDKSYLPQRNPLTVAMVCLALIGLLTAFLGQDFYASFWSGLERMEGLVGNLYMLFYFVVLSTSLKTNKEWKVFFMFSCVTASLLVILGIGKEYALLIEGERLFTHIGNPMYVGLYLVLHLFIVFFLLLDSSNLFKKVSILIIPILLVGLFLSQTRSALLGFFAGLCVVVGSVIISQKKTPLVQVGIVVLLGGFSLLGMGYFYLQHSTLFLENHAAIRRIFTVLTSNGTGISRLNSWKIAYSGFLEHPFLGWGQENYHYVFAKHFIPEMYQDAPWYDRSHNFMLDWLVFGGIIGFVGNLSLYVFLVWLTFKTTHLSIVQKGFVLGILLSYVMANFFGFESLTTKMTFFALLAYWQFLTQEESKPLFQSGKLLHLIVGSLLVILSFQYGFRQPFSTSKKLVELMKESDLGRTVELIRDDYKSIGGTGTSDFAEQVAFLSEKVTQSQVPIEFKNNYYQAVIDIFSQELEKHPNHPRLLSIQSSIEMDRGNLEQAVKGFENVCMLAPNRHINLMQLASAYTKNGQFDKAVQLYEKVYELNKSDESLLYEAQLLSNVSDTSAINSTIAKISNKGFIKQIALIRTVFAKNNQFADFLKELRRRDKLSECDARHEYICTYTKELYFEWSMAAFIIGNYQDSADQLYRYLYEINPDDRLRHQVQQFVKQGQNPAPFFDKY
jgi:O-antigen ligase